MQLAVELTVHAPCEHDDELQAIHGRADDDSGDVARRILGLEDLSTNAVASAVGDEEHGCGDRLLGPAGDVGGYQSPDH